MDALALLNALYQKEVRLIAGVPDSLLNALCKALSRWPGQHLTAANEGNAIGLAVGHHLATGKPACVYMQNSGLGNAVNPLTSLADPAVYGIPMLLIVGFRGEPGTPDEPQHVKQGRITPDLLALLGIPCWIVDAGTETHVLDAAFAHMTTHSCPVALLVRKGGLTLAEKLPAPAGQDLPISREEAISRVLEATSASDLLVATTGKTGRELYELRKARGEENADFLTVGGMGHTSSVALGAALACPSRRVICLDGDGSLLMHMGSAALIGHTAPRNLVHVLLNNLAHESVGGQPTVADSVDFGRVLRACGYAQHWKVDTDADLQRVLPLALPTSGEAPGPCCLEIMCNLHARADLGRPAASPAENKQSFMRKALQ